MPWLSICQDRSEGKPDCLVGGHLQGSQDVGIKFSGGEGVAGSDVSETHQGMHHSQLSWVVEFESGDAFTAGKDGGLRQVMELASVDKAFQDVLLDARDSCRKWPRACLGVAGGFRRPF
jgi:hypothetical protein